MFRLNQKGAFHLLIPIILLIGIIAGVYLVQNTTKLFPKATVSGPVTPRTSFVLTPSKPTYQMGEEVQVDVVFHTDIAAANLFVARVNYDPAVLKLAGFSQIPSDLYQWIEMRVIDPGKASFVVGVANPGVQTQVSDNNYLVRLRFTPLKSGSTTISFDDTSAIYSNADNVNILTSKEPLTINIGETTSIAPSATPTPTSVPVSSSTKKVYLLIFNPVIESQEGKKLIDYAKWSNPDNLASQLISDFNSLSKGFVNYQIVARQEVDDYPAKVDGFKYSGANYLNCISNRDCHAPDIADYNKILSDYKICEKVNSGEINELWMFGGPFFGFYESNLAGPGAFFYNSKATTGTACKELLPIMGFNYERGEAEMFEDFGHRMESTMSRVYRDSTESLWSQFIRSEVPGIAVNDEVKGKGGCGNVHIPVNGTSDYDFSNTRSVSSKCEDFSNYPNLTGNKTTVSCLDWGCNALGYFKWWFSHMPHSQGIGNDGKLNNWFEYLVNPQAVLGSDPTPRPTATPTPVTWCDACSADIIKDADNIVNTSDLLKLTSCFNANSSNQDWESKCKVSDINKDLQVDLTDLNCINDVFGQKCVMPSPTPKASPIPGIGDGNKDGKVDLIDLSILLTDFNKNGGFRTGIDLNGDGAVNTFDFGLMRNLLIEKGVIKADF